MPADNLAFLISVVTAAARKGHKLFKNKGKGMQRACAQLWVELAEELSSSHSMKIDKDLLRKRVWTGQRGEKGFSSYMQQAGTGL